MRKGPTNLEIAKFRKYNDLNINILAKLHTEKMNYIFFNRKFTKDHVVTSKDESNYKKSILAVPQNHKYESHSEYKLPPNISSPRI